MGLPSGSNGGGDIQPRIEYDAKAGRWHRVERSQNAAGEWVTDKFELDKGDMFVADFANIEVGWIAFTPQPDFRMVRNGEDVGPKPGENYKAGFRLSVLLPKEDTFRHFASTARAVIGVVDDLHTKAGEAPAGQVPVVKIAGTRTIETKTPQGTNRNYAPLLEIVKFVPRPAQLGGTAPAPVAPAPVAKAPIDDEVPF
jgi:hypothetical protein